MWHGLPHIKKKKKKNQHKAPDSGNCVDNDTVSITLKLDRDWQLIKDVHFMEIEFRVSFNETTETMIHCKTLFTPLFSSNEYFWKLTSYPI